jgi:hypothetical protein
VSTVSRSKCCGCSSTTPSAPLAAREMCSVSRRKGRKSAYLAAAIIVALAPAAAAEGTEARATFAGGYEITESR